jgi:hypothetical protein
LNAAERSPCHPTNVERAALVPRDKALSHVCRIKPALFNETASDTQRHISIISNRACWLTMDPIPEHFFHTPVFSLNLFRRSELYWTA